MENVKISVIIPIYNEGKSIKILVERLKKALSSTEKSYELIFVDDNSTDETNQIFKDFKNDKQIILVKKVGKPGKAFSLTQGFEVAKGNAIAMIDGDLQYPPEAIPKMIKSLENADVVVANRKSYKGPIPRRLLSSTFRTFFGKFLFGLNHDIQSGLKVMTREVIETVRFNPSSPWTFDLEFLHRAKQAGFKIENFNIDFEKRKNGFSKITPIRQTFEIGTNALRLRAKRIKPVHFPSIKKDSMLGAGVGFKKKKYITHTSMHHSHSAIKTFTFAQKIVIGLILIDLILGFYLQPLLTLQILVAFLSFIYFADVIFNLYLTIKSLTFPNEIRSSDQDLANIDEKKLPVYTILCPLYKEAHVLPQFLSSLVNISWPKDRLDVVLLLEEDDTKTQEKVKEIKLPPYVRALIVPHSIPKTKPKACNFGLAHAKGEYLVVYDAEDTPDPMQLKKAYLGFEKADPKVICLQAKLNYYNPHQNLLTRFFTAEYSLWFDVTLTGLQSINTSIPLGGTSNHFKTKSLLDVQGWDPFNVTEDADLGTRLFKKGFRTAIIDSTTLEEANSKIKNWIRQRSRWIKGYMQTYLVHIREASNHGRKQGVHSLIFQLIIGGKIAFIFINPFLWLATFSYFALYAYVGAAIESLYPILVFYMALTSLVFGNFLFLYYYMIGVAKKGQWSLMKYVLFIPFYWLMISIAAVVALYQLFLKPYHWEKTVHGFHLEKKIKKAVVKEIFEAEEIRTGLVFPKKFAKNWAAIITGKTYIGGGLLVGSSVIANFLNFFFNAYLGRVLGFAEFALIGLMGSFYSFYTILCIAFTTTTTYRSGYLTGKYGEGAGFSFWSFISRKSTYLSLFLAVTWILLTPVLMDYFNSSNPYVFIFFGLILLVGIINGINLGFISSELKFIPLAIIRLFDPIIKLVSVSIFVYAGLKNWSFAAIPLGVIATFTAGTFFIKKQKAVQEHSVPKSEVNKFPGKFFLASILTGFSMTAFITVDILLANHFLSPSEAGQYTLLSLVGKMVFFMGGLVSPFLTTFVSRKEGANKNTEKILYVILFITFLFSLIGFIAFGPLGKITVPILFGEKALVIVPYLTLFTLSIMCYSISKIFINYYLIKRVYSFTVATSLLVILQVILISLHHSNFVEIAFAMQMVWILHLFITISMHLGIKYVRSFENNLSKLFYFFTKTPKKQGSLNILIFNWRDTKHKWAGGAEVYIHELAKRWVKEDNNVTLFSGNSMKRTGNEVLDGVQIIRKGGFYTIYIWAVLYYLFKFRGKFDVVIDSENGIPFFTPLYCRKPKFLLIHHVHQEVFRKSLKRPFSWIALFLEAKLMPLVYRNIQVITVSPSSKEAILKHKLTKIDPIIIYNGVDLETYKPGNKSKNPLILYLGRLQYYKSLHVFLVAAKRVLKKIPNAEFVIAGDGEQKNSLQEFAKKIGILEKIKFLGKVTEEEKINLFQKSWLFVNPSFMEGWGITTIEANACATPAVASDVPGLRDSIKNPHTGILVEYGNYKNFADSIIKLIEDRKLWKEMSRESLNWAQNFDWDASADKFLRILTEHELQQERI